MVAWWWGHCGASLLSHVVEDPPHVGKMGAACGDEPFAHSSCGVAEGEEHHEPFLAYLADEALGVYLPEELLEALLQYHGDDGDVRAVPLRAAKRGRQQAPAGPRGEDAEDHHPDGRRSGAAAQPHRAPQRRPVTETSIATLSGQLQDALLVGIGLLHEEFRATGTAGSVARPLCGGRAVCVAGGGASPFVVWSATKEGVAGFFCSCGTDALDENVGARVRTGESSTCRHAVAHALALKGVAAHVGCESMPALFERFPALDNAHARPVDVHCEEVSSFDDGSAMHGVGHNRIWCVVKTPARKTRKVRPVCQHVPCRTRNAHCIHSCVVKPPVDGYRGFDGQAPDGEDKVDEPPDVPEDPVTDTPAAADASTRERPAAPSARKQGKERQYIDTDYLRRARNLLPCWGESAACRDWDSVARGGDLLPYMNAELYEPHCISCGAEAGPRGDGTSATLHTLSGPVGVRVAEWVCPNVACGKTVAFDGSEQGLFCFSRQAVYTRTFLDVLLFTLITTKSSISAAASASAFQLHTSGALYADDAHSRQELSKATDQYSRTLIVPRQLFRCTDCFFCSQTPYEAVVADGQTIGIFKDQSIPFEKATANVPTIPISVDKASAVPTAKVRKCVRERLKAGFATDVKFNKAEQLAMRKFVALGGVAPPVGDHEDAGHRASCAAWAASCLFNSFFRMTSEPQHEDSGSSASDVPPTSPRPSTGEPPFTNSNPSPPPQSPRPSPPPSSPPPTTTSSATATAGTAGRPTGLRGGGAANGGHAGTAAPVNALKYCSVISDAVGGDSLLPVVRRERWSILFNFFSAFIAEPVIGIFAGCPVGALTELAKALIVCKKSEEWLKITKCIQSLHVVWPALDLLAESMDEDVEMCRAMGELLLFSVHTDLHMEDLWRGAMNAESLLFEAAWTDTDATKFKSWLAQQPVGPGPHLPSGLRSSAASTERAADQATEIRSGVVTPDLDQVRPHPRDDVAAAVARAAKAKAQTAKNPNAKKTSKRKRQQEENGRLGDDDCRHAFVTHSVFTPGVVSYICPCGVLLGFEVLETAESPAGIVAALAARFPRLPKTVYFDTACQSARNATRRMPWLVRISDTAWALDRFHAVQHKCSPLYDANNYPTRSGMHKTSAAENRHSLNKPLKAHLTYLAQDRFIVQMRLIGAINNMLIMYRGCVNRADVRHRPLPAFFHSRLTMHCERLGCWCR